MGIDRVGAFTMVLALAGNTLAAEAAGLDENALKAAAHDFQSMCGSCHGSSGRGDGPAAPALKVTPPDLTKIAQRNGGSFPDAIVWDKVWGLNMPVSHGAREMPVWGGIFIEEALGKFGELPSAADAVEAGLQVRQRMEGLVKYLQSIQVGE